MTREMSSIRLERLLRRAKNSGVALGAILYGLNEPLAVINTQGQILIGENPDETHPPHTVLRSPIQYDGQTAGYVVGLEGSPWPINLATWLNFVLLQEAENKALADEVLDKYRELNLLYRLSEKLVDSPQVEAIAQTALQEACPLIHADNGLALLLPEGSRKLQVIANCGCSDPDAESMAIPGSLVDRVMQNGVAEIFNNIPTNQVFPGSGEGMMSVLCAPLKTKNRTLGGLVLVADGNRQFVAGDLKLLNSIAMQAAPAIEVIHLYQVELEKERIERDLETAYRVQAGLLPQNMPQIEGWEVSALWKPARMVSGDLFDFIPLQDGRWGLVVADVTDKGMPAALLMANTRSVLRAVLASAPPNQEINAGQLLAQVNDIIYTDTPMNMFVTCLLVLLDPKSGRVQVANAGHNPPYLHSPEGVNELRLTGMPLGLFPGNDYDAGEWVIQPGEGLLMYSDGLTEAHDPQGDMYGYPRLHRLLEEYSRNRQPDSQELIDILMTTLENFTGPGWEQEDDVTMLVVERKG